MRFSMLFALTLVVTLSSALDAEARGGRRNKKRDCRETRVVADPCCGTAGYGQVGYAGGYAVGNSVNSFGVAPAPMTMPMPGVVQADGTTTQPGTGVIVTSGTTTPNSTQQQQQLQQQQQQQMQHPMHTSPMVATQGVYGHDCGCPDGSAYASSGYGYDNAGYDSGRRRGLFRGRR
jgi:hypothetical protein